MSVSMTNVTAPRYRDFGGRAKRADDIRHIVKHAPQHLKPPGWLLFEHGYNQTQAVAQLMQAAGFVQVQRAMDMAGV